MGYLFFSVGYPSDVTRASYLGAVDPTFVSTTFALYPSLPASATIEEWNEILTLLQETSPGLKDENESIILSHGEDGDKPRPLRPNDDNYSAFTGPQWKRYPKQTRSPSVAPELAGFLEQARNDSEPTPHYDHCAYCTAHPAEKRCSRCKLVQYCSRDCQAHHWKQIHNKSCIPAEGNRSLWQAMQTNDGFLVSPDECRLLSQWFDKCSQQNKNHAQSYMLEGFQHYFEHVADLGGCFVL